MELHLKNRELLFVCDHPFIRQPDDFYVLDSFLPKTIQSIANTSILKTIRPLCVLTGLLNNGPFGWNVAYFCKNNCFYNKSKCVWIVCGITEMITQKDVNAKQYIVYPHLTPLVWGVVCVVADCTPTWCQVKSWLPLTLPLRYLLCLMWSIDSFSPVVNCV